VTHRKKEGQKQFKKVLQKKKKKGEKKRLPNWAGARKSHKTGALEEECKDCGRRRGKGRLRECGEEEKNLGSRKEEVANGVKNKSKELWDHKGAKRTKV